MQPSTVVILGSTGSIGTQGLDVISRHLDRFTVTGLAAGGAHVELLAQQAAKFHVPTVAIFYKEAVPALREALEQAGAGNVNITAGPDAVIAMAGSGADVVLNGITGSIGLEPSIAALQAGSQLALANKESVVAGGHLLFSAQVRWQGQPLPGAQVRMYRINTDKTPPALPTPWHCSLEARADADGNVAFVLNRSGWWCCVAETDGEPLKGPDGNPKPLRFGGVFWLYVDDMAAAPSAEKKR